MRLTALLLTAVFAAGCANTEQPEPQLDAVTVPAPETQAPAVSDAEIAAIVVAANEIDAVAGELAAERATRDDVRAFARTMVTDHRAVNQQAAALIERLGVTPVPNEVSRSLESDAAKFREELSAKPSAEFDLAYIEHEVAYHQAVIDAVDQLLIPNAQNAELRQTLVSVRPALVAHLEHARQLRQTLAE
ncbi:MAG TPA: DUF4142 domain-containing protein [Longimicrobiales bacterium]|nr:DUF4142 domain-containing protein [Longimicrobiales bacterium]